MASSGSVPGKGRIRASVKKLSRRVPENGRISVNTEKWYHPSHYREKVESVRVSKNCLGGVPKKGRICVSTEKWHNSGQYREKVESVRVSKNCLGEYRKRVEFV